MITPEEFEPEVRLRQELELAYEELAVAAEELREQNDELLAAREALEAERRRYQKFFDLAPDAYLVTDLQGVIQRANQAAATLFDAGQPTLLGRPLRERVPAAVLPELGHHLAELQAGEPGVTRGWEMRLQSLQGRSFDAALTVSTIQLHAEEPVTLGWLIRDVSERKEAERALRAALAEAEEGRRTLDALLKYVPEGITLSVGPDMEITHSSSHAEKMLGPRTGRSVAEILQQGAIYDSDGVTPLAPDDLPLVRAVRYGEVVQGRELSQRTASGDRVWLSCNAGPIRNAAGEITGGVLAWRDVTEQRRASEALRQLARVPEESPDPGLRVAEDGQLLWANESGYEWLESMGGAAGRPLPTALQALVSQAWQQQGQVIQVEVGDNDGRTFSLVVFRPGEEQQVALHARDITDRKRAEDALRQSEAKLQALFEILPVGISILDAERRVRYNNPALSHILDLPAEDLAQGRYRQRSYLRPDGSPMSVDELASARAFREQRPVHDVETGVVQEDGTVVWTNVSAVPLPFDDWRVILVTSDITEKVRARQRVEEQAALLDTMLASIADAVAFYGVDGRIVRTNAAADEMFGYVPGNPILSLAERASHTHPRREDGQPYALEELPVMRALRGETVTGVLMAVDLRPGSTAWLDVSAGPVRVGGNLLGAIVVFTDVTELRRARDELELRVQERTTELVKLNEVLQGEIAVRRQREAELNESELRFRQMAENIEEVFWLAEPEEARLLYLSPAYEAMWGRAAREVYEHPQLVLRDVHPDDHKAVGSLWNGTTREQVEFRLVLPDGTIRWLRGRAFPVEGEPETPRRFAGVVNDFTAEKQAQAALIFAERLSTAGRMAASLSHEINNPLQSAIGCVDLAREDLEAGRDPRHYLMVVSDALARAARVVARLRDMNRQWRTEERRPSDLKEAVDRALLLTQRSYELKGVNVVREVEANLPQVPLMGDGIQQVFLNLVLNALDAMPIGGTLRISIEASAQPHGVIVRVADTGVGIPAAELEHLFEPFRGTETDGLGLGLFICHNIIAQHGGQLDVDSEEGKGTEVRVWLPV